MTIKLLTDGRYKVDCRPEGSDGGRVLGNMSRGVYGLSTKLRAMRKAERLNQREFCEVLGFSESTYRKYEGGFIEVGAPALLKIANHPDFKKYALWLITGDTAPACGQVSPVSR